MHKNDYNNFLKIFTGLCLLIAGLLMHPEISQANSDTYEINRYHMTVNIQQDGSAFVQQDIQFQFKDSVNGVYLVQDLKTTTGQQKSLENPKMTIMTANNQWQVIGRTNTETSDHYQLTSNKQAYRFKLFHPAKKGDQLNVRLTYQLKNLIINYQDTAELNWRVIGNKWDSPLNNVKIQINLPQSVKAGTLKSWTHGALDGQQTVAAKKGQVTLTLDQNPANQFLETHLIFPKQLTAKNQNTIEQTQKAKIIATETKLAKQTNRKRQFKKIGKISLNLIVFILAPGIIYLTLHQKRQKVVPERYAKNWPEHVYDLPDESSPVVAKALISLGHHGKFDLKPDANDLSAGILDMIAKHHLKIDLVPNPKKPKKNDYQLTLNAGRQLDTTEKQLVSLLFERITNQNTVTLSEIETYAKKHSELFWKGIKRWQKLIEKQAKSATYLHLKTLLFAQQLKDSIGLSIFLAVATMFGVIFGLINPLVCLIFIIVLLYLIWELWHLPFWTQAGYAQQQNWLGFKRMLKDVANLDMSKIGDVILWDRYLSYATAFGVSKEVSKQLTLQFPSTTLETMPLGAYYLGYSSHLGNHPVDFSHALNKSLSYAVNTANPTSTSGGSGGFSGGSSGGFGGGSGGGTF